MMVVETQLTSDAHLLRALAASRSREAFGVIVERYLGLVYASARRQVGEAMAEDLTQAVFLLLWERPTRVRDGSSLAGWLINATRLAALQARRTERRRLRREHIVAAERRLITGDPVTQSTDELAPLIDAALAELTPTERSAVALRYLQEQSLEQVAAAAGISTATAAKRVSRGLDRLRRAFARQGVAALPAATIGPALIEIGRRSAAPPSALAGHVLSNAIAGKSVASMAIAKGIGATLMLHKLGAIAAAILVATAVVAGSWLAMQIVPASADTTTTAPAQAASAPPLQPDEPVGGGPIRVGVSVSKLTAETDSPSGKPWGYQGQTRIVSEISTPDIEIIPIIEPGSAANEAQVAELKRFFPGKEPIDAGDVAALRRLNVIVANAYWMMPADVLKPYEEAVGGGVNLLNIGGMGWASPGFRSDNPAPVRLAGLLEANGGYTDGPARCDVLAPHEILGQLGSLKTITLKPLGAFGALPVDAVPLMKVTDMSVIHTRGPAVDDASYGFYPIYISHLERGKIIGIQFSPFGLSNRAQRSTLLIRSVRWLAGRPVE